MRHYHEYLGHAGREHVLSTLRQRFWLLQARTLIRQVLRKCVSFRKRNEAPMQQLMADLPKERLIPFEPPFTYTGVDLFGPFHVKRGRRAEKVYGCLFTCFTSRAVHIEDVSSLETRLLYSSPSKIYFKSWLSKRNMERQCDQFCSC